MHRRLTKAMRKSLDNLGPTLGRDLEVAQTVRANGTQEVSIPVHLREIYIPTYSCNLKFTNNHTYERTTSFSRHRQSMNVQDTVDTLGRPFTAFTQSWAVLSSTALATLSHFCSPVDKNKSPFVMTYSYIFQNMSRT